MPNSDFSETISELLDKIIETHAQNARIMAEFKNSLESNNQVLRDIQKEVAEINAHFSNGFRHEIKEHISDMTESIETSITDKIDDIQISMTSNATADISQGQQVFNALSEFIATVKSPKSWLSAFIFMGSLIGIMATIVTVIIKFIGP